MRKSELTNGRKILIVRVDHFVKKEDFAKSLTEYFYINDQCFNEKLTKKCAEEILRKRLFFNGLHGEIDTTMYESSSDFFETWNPIYQQALRWVEEKYPYYNK